MGNDVNPSDSSQEELQQATQDVISKITADDWDLMADALEAQGQGGRLRNVLVDRARQLARSIRDQQLKS
jgi:truncated hemoglobin YjbI